MKKINKQAPPAALTDFVSKEHPSTWAELHEKAYATYQICVAQLQKEQDGMCGYTERPVSIAGGGTHIDHFVKRDHNAKMIFDWQNLVLAVHASGYGADWKDLHIKKSAYGKIINPVKEDPHLFFTYMPNGMIKPKNGLTGPDREKAEFTIEVFNLNHNFLCSKRLGIIKMITDYKQSGLSVEEILSCVSDYGFRSAIEYAL